jgi:hypothetical protein
MANLNRRAFLGGVAGSAAGGLAARLAAAARMHGGRPLAPLPTHHPARAKHLIFVFLTGGFSHIDTFDFKPKLRTDHRRLIPAESLREASAQPLLASPFRFSPHGESGLVISELFPHLALVADDLCVIRTLHTDILEHFQAVLAMHTGSSTVPMPSLGAWLSYGLGTLNPNLPAYMVLCEHLPYAGAQVWDSSFLPPEHQGLRLLPGERPIPYLERSLPAGTLAELEQRMLDDLNESHAVLRGNDPHLRARISSFHTARGMMRIAPAVFDLSRETAAIHELYGLESEDRRSFAWQCLVARRLVEQGVRTVELIDTGAGNNWDSHGNMEDHRPKAARVDRALAGLLVDLKQRGLLDETLVAICTEFGRTPWDPGLGRNHWHRAFTCLLSGGGVKGGVAWGATDEYGIAPVRDPVHVHDYHATILHLMGIDHTRLTYRYAGRDFRLTDVHGTVIEGVLA